MVDSLPPNDKQIWQQMVKCYENRQFDKAISNADKILKTHETHAETIAMKALILDASDSSKKDEAFDLVKKSLRYGIRSSTCWHVYGLMHKNHLNQVEAIKCFKNALRIEKDNSQILRDLSSAQIHVRDFPGFLESRQAMLTSKPGVKINWLAFAVAQALVGEAANATRTIDSCLDAFSAELEGVQAIYEMSEMQLFKLKVLLDAGLNAEVVKLSANLLKLTGDKRILDKTALYEMRAEALLKLQKHKEAETQYRQLLQTNSHSYAYIAGFALSRQLPDPRSLFSSKSPSSSASHVPPTKEQRDGLLALYDELALIYPRASALKRFPLDAAEGTDFSTRLDGFVRPYLRKSIPSLFSELKSLYNHQEKVTAMHTLFSSYEKSLTETNKFPDSAAEEAEEAPSVLLWVLHLLACHHDRVGNTAEALRYADAAIQHTPTFIDLYVTKARIFKHSGDLQGAADMMDRARKLDLGDRNLNTKCTRYMLRANRYIDAEKTIALFSKEGANSNLYDMQCSWYELEAAACLQRKGLLSRAVQKYRCVEKHYSDITEDQYDFHQYCMRKGTLRSYLDMLKWGDRLLQSPAYKKAATGLIECFIAMADDPESEARAVIAENAAEEAKKVADATKAGIVAAEADQHEHHASSSEPSSSSSAAPSAAASEKAPVKTEKKEKPKQEDGSSKEPEVKPREDDPLGEASKLVQALETQYSQEPNTHFLSFQVSLRSKQPLLALRALIKLSESQDSRFAACKSSFADAVSNSKFGEVTADVKASLDAEGRPFLL